MEKVYSELYAEVLLWYHGFNDKHNYELLLNEAFLNDPSNDFLLELQERSSNLLDTRGRFTQYWSYEEKSFDSNIFGKRLFAGLESAYKVNIFSIDQFGKQCYQLCKDLPSDIQEKEPFWTLKYADECLSWGDEAQTRMIYEKLFSFYK